MRGLLRVLGGSAVAPPYEKMKQPRVQPHGLAGVVAASAACLTKMWTPATG